MSAVDTIITLVILALIILVIWSRVMGQTMYDTIMEIKEIIQSFSVTDSEL